MAGMSTPVGLTPNFASMTPEQIQATWLLGHQWETVLWIVWPTIQQYYPLHSITIQLIIQNYVFLQLSNMTFPFKVFLLEVLRSSLNQEVGSQADHQRVGISLNDNSQSSGSLEWVQLVVPGVSVRCRNQRAKCSHDGWGDCSVRGVPTGLVQKWFGWTQLVQDGGPSPTAYWCSVGNGWEWGNGMIIDSYCGSFPHSLRLAPVSDSRWWPLTNSIDDSFCVALLFFRWCEAQVAIQCVTNWSAAVPSSEDDGSRLFSSWISWNQFNSSNWDPNISSNFRLLI